MPKPKGTAMGTDNAATAAANTLNRAPLQGQLS